MEYRDQGDGTGHFTDFFPISAIQICPIQHRLCDGFIQIIISKGKADTVSGIIGLRLCKMVPCIKGLRDAACCWVSQCFHKAGAAIRRNSAPVDHCRRRIARAQRGDIRKECKGIVTHFAAVCLQVIKGHCPVGSRMCYGTGLKKVSIQCVSVSHRKELSRQQRGHHGKSQKGADDPVFQFRFHTAHPLSLSSAYDRNGTAPNKDRPGGLNIRLSFNCFMFIPPVFKSSRPGRATGFFDCMVNFVVNLL